MKKILFWAAVTILAAVSCNKIEEEGAPTFEPSNVPSFVASVDGADTKTVIVVEGEGEDAVTKSYWNGTESIRVFDGKLKNGKVYTATVAEKVESTIFNEEDGTTLSETAYLAAYPAGPAGSVTWDGKVENAAKKFWLPANQKAVLGTYEPSTHIAVAYTETGDNLEFKNVNALIKFNVTGNNIKEVCFFGNNKEVIAGNFDVKYNSGEPTYTNTDASYTKDAYAKIEAEDGKTLAPGEYYISVLPSKFTKGFCLETVTSTQKTQKFSHTNYDLKRGQILDLGTVAAPASLTTKPGYIYLKPGAEWRVDDARFAAFFFGKEDKWVDMKMVTGQTDVYECQVPEGAAAVIFCRMNGGKPENNWNNKWGQTVDLSLAGGNIFTVITPYDENHDKKATGAWSGNATVTMLYLKPTGDWKKGDERYAAYFFGNGDRWVSMIDSDKDGIYEVANPRDKNFKNIIFCRMNGGTTENNWNNKWDQTADLTIPTNGNNLYTIGSSWTKK